MRRFACSQVSTLLRRLFVQVRRAATAADADAVHDLRVAVRRLSRALRTFAQFFPGRSWKRIRTRLSEWMELTGAVRDCDIALELLEKAGVSERARVAAALQSRRSAAEVELQQELQRCQERDLARIWRERLEL